jgi:hypothetical protein
MTLARISLTGTRILFKSTHHIFSDPTWLIHVMRQNALNISDIFNGSFLITWGIITSNGAPAEGTLEFSFNVTGVMRHG